MLHRGAARGAGLYRLPGPRWRPGADGVFAALQAHLSDEEILELTYITAMYEMHAVMSTALRLEWDNRDEPIVEIAAPEGFTSFDVGDAIALRRDENA